MRCWSCRPKGAQILDMRDADGIWRGAFDGQHQYWIGRAVCDVGRERCSNRVHPIVIIADPGRENEAAMRLGRIGFDHVAGYLQRWFAGLEARPELTRDGSG